MCVQVPEARRGHQIPWRWSYRWLWATWGRCWESNLGPYKRTKLFFQPLFSLLCRGNWDTELLSILCWRGCTHRILFSTMTIYRPSRLSTHLLPLYPTHSSPKLPLLRPSNSVICQHSLSHQPRKRGVRFGSLTVTSQLSLPWEGPALLHPPFAMARKGPPDSCFSHGPRSCFLVYTVCKRLARISGWVIWYFTAKGKFLWPLIFHAQKWIAQVYTVTLPPWQPLWQRYVISHHSREYILLITIMRTSIISPQQITNQYTVLQLLLSEQGMGEQMRHLCNAS